MPAISVTIDRCNFGVALHGILRPPNRVATYAEHADPFCTFELAVGDNPGAVTVFTPMDPESLEAQAATFAEVAARLRAIAAGANPHVELYQAKPPTYTETSALDARALAELAHAPDLSDPQRDGERAAAGNNAAAFAEGATLADVASA